MTQRDRETASERRFRVALRRIGVWLDAWCLRGYTQDTHCWAAKIENLRSLKRDARQIR